MSETREALREIVEATDAMQEDDSVEAFQRREAALAKARTVLAVAVPAGLASGETMGRRHRDIAPLLDAFEGAVAVMCNADAEPNLADARKLHEARRALFDAYSAEPAR